MFDLLDPGLLAALIGGAGGLVLGLAARLGRFCSMGAIEDALYQGSDLRARQWGVALGVALIGTFTLIGFGLFDPAMSPYLALKWYPMAHAVSGAFGLPTVATGIVAGLAILTLALSSRAFRAQRRLILWGSAVGLAIVSGWAGTSWLSLATFEAEPVASHTFSAPIGDTLFYLMTSSASSPGFGVGSVSGALLGAAIGSLIKGQFRWEACEDPRELKRQIGGAALMGVGAVVGFGCTVGQGLSAFSVLAFSAPVTIIAIIIGAAIGLRQLIYGFAFGR